MFSSDHMTSNATITNTTTVEYASVSALTVLKCLPMILIGLAAFFGNGLVLFALYRFKHLRTFSNLYLSSLAVTDVLAALIMPLSYVTVLLDARWVFGTTLCKMQGFGTTFLSSASMLTLLFFSIYRCYLITTVKKTLPIHMVRKMVKVSVGLIWGLAFLYSIPPLFGGGYVGFLSEYKSCLYDFSSSKPYTAFLVIWVFSLPLLVMLIAYVKIIRFILLHNQTIAANSAKSGRNSAVNTPSCSCASEEANNHMTVMELKRKLEHFDDSVTSEERNRVSSIAHNSNSKTTETKPQDEEHRPSRKPTQNLNPLPEVIEMTRTWTKDANKDDGNELQSENTSEKVTSYSPNQGISRNKPSCSRNESVSESRSAYYSRSESISGNITSYSPNEGSSSENMGALQERRKTMSMSYVIDKWRTRTRSRQHVLKQYRKSVTHQAKLARILLVTVLAFVFCWTPFAVDSLLQGFGHTETRPKHFRLVTIWLAYTNAICNPIIYALLNGHFRKAFITILKEFGQLLCICKR